MLTMAKPGKRKHVVTVATDGEAKTRRRAGAVEVYNEKEGRWIALPTVPGLLDRLRSDGKISEDDFQAGVRFSKSFEAAGLGARYGSIAFDAIRVDGGGKWQEPIGGSAMARDEVINALEHVGGFGGECLWWLLGLNEGIAEFTWRCRSAGRLIHERAVQFALVVALGSLTSFYARERRYGEGR